MTSVIQKAEQIFKLNKTAEEKLQLLIIGNPEGSPQDLTYDDFSKLNAKLLTAYILVREKKDITKPSKKLKKGTVEMCECRQLCLLLKAK